MKTFNNLYALDKKGKLRVFCVEAFDNGTFTTWTGLVGGKLTSKCKTVSPKNIGKANETNVIVQAELEAQSKWESKLDEGYKSHRMVRDKFPQYVNAGLLVSGDDITVESFAVSRIYTSAGITQNTNKDWLPLPMLAQRLDKIKGGIYYKGHVQRKLNGVRCIAMYINEKVVLSSRGGGYYEIPHISKQLIHIFSQYPHVILDGEIYTHGVPLQIISGAVRRGNSMFDDKSWLEYHVYDVIISNTQLERLHMLDDINFDLTSNIFRVKSIYLDNHTRLISLHDKFVKEGYEGAIFRPDNGLYESGFRSNDLIKIKNYIDAEFEILGCKVDDNQSIGDSFVFRLRNDIDEQVFYARPTGTKAMKEYWYRNINKLIGKMVTVRFQERSDDGLPTQGHVRSDLSKLPVVEIIDNRYD